VQSSMPNDVTSHLHVPPQISVSTRHCGDQQPFQLSEDEDGGTRFIVKMEQQMNQLIRYSLPSSVDSMMSFGSENALSTNRCQSQATSCHKLLVESVRKPSRNSVTMSPYSEDKKPLSERLNSARKSRRSYSLSSTQAQPVSFKSQPDGDPPEVSCGQTEASAALSQNVLITEGANVVIEGQSGVTVQQAVARPSVSKLSAGLAGKTIGRKNCRPVRRNSLVADGRKSNARPPSNITSMEAVISEELTGNGEKDKNRLNDTIVLDDKHLTSAVSSSVVGPSSKQVAASKGGGVNVASGKSVQLRNLSSNVPDSKFGSLTTGIAVKSRRQENLSSVHGNPSNALSSGSNDPLCLPSRPSMSSSSSHGVDRQSRMKPSQASTSRLSIPKPSGLFLSFSLLCNSVIKIF